MISKERLFISNDGSRVCTTDDPEAAGLLVGEGCELEDSVARQHGLLDEKPKSVKSKQVEGPPENKAIIPPENKRS